MNLFQQGGPLMWPLLALSVATLAVMAERFVVFTTTHFPDRDSLSSILEMLRQGNTRDSLALVQDSAPFFAAYFVALLAPGTARQREAHAQLAGEEALFSLSRRLDFLSTAASAAPLIGLLGTVAGMISAFSKLASSGNVDITMLAGGIWQALLTTGAGLCIAIPALLAHRWFLRQHEKTAFAMQRAAALLLEVEPPEPKA
ncbi:outer membrane transport energization protein ExbB [Humidesulfovibrio mexicanus]|uniref:Outer membrane transport energization protein ExbB n=1 Tax=Humidesulfovibrio mexicanus TaxID=147047 RepID=A0A238YV79_9BACT|nr:MotA/TolQ/ExbB proton channel family protein [Humidesulfovibrio mexicanus]SNR74359.1 outer membrane transport energization protein ExbB [Humidesulfovibrio mexicanus]